MIHLGEIMFLSKLSPEAISRCGHPGQMFFEGGEVRCALCGKALHDWLTVNQLKDMVKKMQDLEEKLKLKEFPA